MKNIIEKIWDSHTVKRTSGHPGVLYIDLLLLHEVTSAQAFQILKEKKLDLKNPNKCLATIDHSIPTRKDRHIIYDATAKKQVETLRKNVKKNKIPFYDMGSGNQGIIHVIAPELGTIHPGMIIACGDSHTSTHGAFGSIAFGIGSSEVAHIMATQCLLQYKPKTFKVRFSGKLKKGVYSKDIILKLIEKIGISGANGHIIEYTGETISNMSMEERMTVCNMSIECGARAGVIAPDETTYKYIEKHSPINKTELKKLINNWKKLTTDSNAKYDKEIHIQVDNLDPMITWGTNPEQAIEITKKIPDWSKIPNKQQETAKSALTYTKLKKNSSLLNTPIDYAFVGSCTNGRIEDLRIVAELLKKKKVHKNVTFYIVPGSEKVMKQAQNEKLDIVFTKAGADFRNPGCSLCLGMNDDKVPAGNRCISSSNRNFVGRQGTGSITHLASPATVTKSAIAGKISYQK